MDNLGLWNKNTIDKYYISLIFLAVLTFIYIGFKYIFKEAFKNNPKAKNILIYLICAFVSFWIWSWAIVFTNGGENDGNAYDESNYNFRVSFFSLAGPVIGLFFFLWLAKYLGTVSWSIEQIFFISLFTLVVGYVILSCIYFIDFSLKEGNGFPIENPQYFQAGGVGQNVKEALKWSASAFTGLALLFGIIALLDSKEQIILPTESIKKGISYTAVACAIIAVLLWVIYPILNLIPENVSDQNIYTGWIICSNFFVLGLLLISLTIVLGTNYYERETNFILNDIGLVSALSAFIVSVCNMFFSTTQSIKNTENFGNARLNNGNEIKNYNESSYDLLNFGMSYNYLSLSMLSFLMVIYSLFSLFNDKKVINKLSKFFTFKTKDLEYDWWSLALFLAATGIAVLSIFLGTVIGQGSEFGSINSDFIFTGQGATASFSVSVLFFTMYIIELLYNRTLKEDVDKSTFVLKMFQFFVILAFFCFPIVSLLIYLTNIPKFYIKINNSGDEILVFGDNSNKNGIANINGNQTDDNSNFSVGSNFSYYSNGLFLTGGRTSLDLDTTRGIRYVSNQGGYYNFKYLYDNLDFKEISVDDDLNIFNLETNDVSYGAKNNPSDAFLVIVGENVGLTDNQNSTIYYNTIAGASNNQEIPQIDQLGDWNMASSGAFSFKGAGVVSGVSSDGNNRWVAVGQDNVDYPSSNFNTIKYSDDGINWSNATGTSFNGYGNKVGFGVSSSYKNQNTYIAVGYDISGNNILRSIDGIEWSTTTNSFNREGSDVAYGLSGNGISTIWVAVGQDDVYPVKYSIDDGSTWLNSDNTTYSFSKPDDVNAITYDLKNKRFYIAGKKASEQSVYYSSNGLSWTPASGYDFDNATSITYNLENEFTGFDDIYYPPRNYQNFFVDKVENSSLRQYLIVVYSISFILIILTFYTMYRTSKDSFVKLAV